MSASSATVPPGNTEAESRASWRPMIGLALAQVLMSFNVSALPVSLGGMVDDFGTPPTTVSTAIVAYGLVVAALVMVGAKVGQRIGWVLIFRVVVAVFAVAELMMVFAPHVGWVIAAQALAGASAAIIVPAIVALIAENYRANQQATAIGSLGSARAFAGMAAFFIGGALGTLVGWRPVFAILVGVAIVVFLLSFTLHSDRGDRSITIDVVGATLIGAGVLSLTLGFNNLDSWGVLAAAPEAPVNVFGMSLAPLLIGLGVVLGQGFFVWTRRRSDNGDVPLISLDVVARPTERAAVYAMFIVVALEAALNFTVPLYIQIVQGRSAFDTSLAMMPFNITVFVTALVVVRFYGRFAPRTIARFSFALTTGALVWLSFVVTNNWETVPTIIGLIVFGIGQGALVTLVFNVLVTAVPKDLAGDVGSLRGTAQNLASAVGTALAGALLVTLLSIGVGQAVASHVELPEYLVAQVDLDNVNFVSNERLEEILDATTATDTQVDAAVQINIDARLDALRIGLLTLAALSAIAWIPASRLPNYRKQEIPDPVNENG